MRLISFLFLFAPVMFSACLISGDTETIDSLTPRFKEIEQSEDFPVMVPTAFDSTLGWLVVPEDRSDVMSNEIKLPVAIIHADAEFPKSPVWH